MDILLESRRVRLDQRAIVGAGGEATIIRHEGQAIKVYHTPTAARAAKLRDLVALPISLPVEVVAPEMLAYNVQGSEIIGFAMRLLAPGYTEIARLANKRFRAGHGITAQSVAALFIQMHKTLSALHGAGFVVGDLNDLNVLFEGSAPAFIDVDSYQFGAHRCTVATEAYIDPALYGADLSQGVAFSAKNDWYSFAALLFRSLLMVHPYGGVHPTVQTLTARATQRITAMAPGVRYPKIALHPDVLGDDLLDVFARYFAEGWRGIFPLNVLEAYHAELIPCPDCGAYYPHARPQCPVCSAPAVIVLPPRRRVVADGCTVEMLVQADGNLVFAKADGGTIYAVAHEGKQAVLYRMQDGVLQRMPLFNHIPGARYDATDGCLIVSPDPTQEALMVVDVTGTEPRGALQTTTQCFGGAEPAFGAGGGALYRAAGGYLTRGEIRGDALIERPLTTAMEHQTWLRVAPNGTMALGYFRTFRTRQYFLIHQSSRHEIDLPPLAAGESLTACDVLFGQGAALAIRHTRQAGMDYVRLDETNGEGRVVFSQRRKAAGPLYAAPGAAYMAGVVLHATDDGIVQERLADGALRTFAATEPYIAAGDRLIPYGGGVLVVKSDRVLLLTLENR